MLGSRGGERRASCGRFGSRGAREGVGDGVQEGAQQAVRGRQESAPRGGDGQGLRRRGGGQFAQPQDVRRVERADPPGVVVAVRDTGQEPFTRRQVEGEGEGGAPEGRRVVDPVLSVPAPGKRQDGQRLADRQPQHRGFAQPLGRDEPRLRHDRAGRSVGEPPLRHDRAGRCGRDRAVRVPERQPPGARRIGRFEGDRVPGEPPGILTRRPHNGPPAP
ncbi:hypothetical protein GA0115246_1121510 [Streptomyces sp. SolWspMP-sol7th]|nr:hypothetical protein GA0115246_1121510 [Streptomyces sp. SolWspMP-sol7th]